MGKSIRQLLASAWHAVTATWMIVGVSIVMLLLVESCVRLRGPRSLSNVPAARSPAERDPRNGTDWYADYRREFEETRGQRWKSYVYFGRAPGYHGRYVNIDSAGHRVTPLATPLAGAPARRLFFFGGSTMWGTGLRDDHTIPAEVARRLPSLGAAGADVEITNFGESGYVSTQELLQLMLELRAGHVPDVVVFYDGINDAAATVQFGRPGVPQNESKRVAEFAMGRALDRTPVERGLRKDLRRAALLTGQVLQQSELVTWARSLRPAPPLALPDADSAARGTARIYAENMRLVEALAAQYGFTPIYVWQPTFHATDKTLAPFEQRMMRAVDADSFEVRLREVHRRLPPLVAQAMAPIAGARFVDATHVFQQDTTTVFVDYIGHNTDYAIPRIVDAFWPTLQAALVRPRPAAR